MLRQGILTIILMLCCYALPAQQSDFAPPSDSVRSTESIPEPSCNIAAFISKHVVYPPYCVDHNISGKCIVSFVIDTTGNVGNAKIAQSSGNNLLDEEALRVIKLLPPFTPASVGGKPVKFLMKQPVTFKLK